MLAVQLHALDTAVVVDLEPVGGLDLRTAAQLRVLGGAAKVAEGDRLDRFAVRTIGRSELHFEVLAADDPRIDNLEIPVEDGLRKTLAPRAGAAQNPGGVEGKLGGHERAVRVNHARERFVVRALGNLGRKSGSERRQVFRRQAHPGRHGVAAEFVDETRVTGRNAIQSVANLHAGNGTPRAAQGTVLSARAGNDRPMQSVLNPSRYETHHALMPALA